MLPKNDFSDAAVMSRDYRKCPFAENPGHKKAIDRNQSLVVFDFVGAEGFEPPTLCL